MGPSPLLPGKQLVRVGGTLTANPVSRRLKSEIDDDHASVTLVDATGAHVYQPGFMYIALGNEKPEHLQRPERSLLDDRVDLVTRVVERADEATRQVVLVDGTTCGYDYLVLATGARILPESNEHVEQEAHYFYAAGASGRLRTALVAFTGGKIVIGIASMPYKCSPIGRAFSIESVNEMATPILEQKGIELHTFFNVSTIGAERKVDQSLEGEELPDDPLILLPAHKGQRHLMDSRLAPAPGGWLPTERHTLRLGGRHDVFALGDATDLPFRRPAPPRTSRRPSSRSRSGRASRAARPMGITPRTRARSCASSRWVTGRGRSSSSTTTTRPSRPSPARSGTWASWSSTRRTPGRSVAAASDLRPPRLATQVRARDALALRRGIGPFAPRGADPAPGAPTRSARV